MTRRPSNPEFDEILEKLSQRTDYIEDRTQYGAKTGFIWLICFSALALILGFSTLWAFSSLLLLSFILSGVITGIIVEDPEQELRRTASEVLLRRIVDRERSTLMARMDAARIEDGSGVDILTKQRAIAADLVLAHDLSTKDLPLRKAVEIIETKLAGQRPERPDPHTRDMLQKIRYTQPVSPSPFRAATGG